MAEEISSHILDWNTECLNFNLWQLGRMWSETSQKWQTWTNLGTLVFLTTNLISNFGFYLKKEQFGLIWPTTPQRWPVDLGLETSAYTSKLLPLSNLTK